VKRCPTCNKTFSEDHLIYCVDDGTPLVVDDGLDEATLVRPSVESSPGSSQGDLSSSQPNDGGTPAYQPPRPYVPPDYQGSEKRRTWPLALGILLIVCLVVVGLGVAAAVFIPRMLRASINSNNTRQHNLNSNSNWNANNQNENWNENRNENGNGNGNVAVDDTTPPPTDQAQVLADLRDLEDEWTVANINADKKKLDRILADDYVGITNGQSQGKAQYLKTIERDTGTQHWEFNDLKLTLSGDRATLTGIVTYDAKNQAGEDQEFVFRFTDKFVWRDGRWQATGSEVDALPEKPN